MSILHGLEFFSQRVSERGGTIETHDQVKTLEKMDVDVQKKMSNHFCELLALFLHRSFGPVPIGLILLRFESDPSLKV